MRAFSNALPATLVVVALFWGNCFSCPQLLLTLAKHDAHSCCHRSAPAPEKCATGVLKQFVKADPVSVGAPAAVAEHKTELTAAPVTYSVAVVLAPPVPLDLLRLTSLLRI